MRYKKKTKAITPTAPSNSAFYFTRLDDHLANLSEAATEDRANISNLAATTNTLNATNAFPSTNWTMHWIQLLRCNKVFLKCRRTLLLLKNLSVTTLFVFLRMRQNTTVGLMVWPTAPITSVEIAEIPNLGTRTLQLLNASLEAAPIIARKLGRYVVI